MALSENVSATVLYPPRDIEASGDANAVSMLLRIDYGEASALFTGDLEIADEPGPMPDVDVLKVPHHGSDNSSSLMFLHSASPYAALDCTATPPRRFLSGWRERARPFSARTCAAR